MKKDRQRGKFLRGWRFLAMLGTIVCAVVLLLAAPYSLNLEAQATQGASPLVSPLAQVSPLAPIVVDPLARDVTGFNRWWVYTMGALLVPLAFVAWLLRTAAPPNEEDEQAARIEEAVDK